MLASKQIVLYEKVCFYRTAKELCAKILFMYNRLYSNTPYAPLLKCTPHHFIDRCLERDCDLVRSAYLQNKKLATKKKNGIFNIDIEIDTFLVYGLLWNKYTKLKWNDFRFDKMSEKYHSQSDFLFMAPVFLFPLWYNTRLNSDVQFKRIPLQ